MVGGFGIMNFLIRLGVMLLVWCLMYAVGFIGAKIHMIKKEGLKYEKKEKNDN